MCSLTSEQEGLQCEPYGQTYNDFHSSSQCEPYGQTYNDSLYFKVVPIHP